MPGLRSDLRRLAGSSAVYGVGTILLRALNFLLLPLYTQYLAPSDYGVVTLAATVTSVLGIIYPLGLHGAVTRFYFTTDDAHERRRLMGTFWLAMIGVSLVLAVLLDHTAGPALARLFPDVPFSPFLRIGIWTAFFNVFSLVPLAVMQAEERPAPYVAASVVSALLGAAGTLIGVVFLRLGATGYLLGVLAGSAAAAIMFVALTLRSIAFRPAWGGLAAGLAFALPLIPHGLASWVLDLSDRVLLGHYVATADVGRYALAVQFGAILGIVGTALNNAWVPFVYRRHAEGETGRDSFGSLSTAFAAVVTFGGVALALLGGDAIRLVTAAGYHPAAALVPWLVGGYWFAALYYLPCAFLFVSGRTGWVSLVTLISGAVNVGANLFLMPRYGVAAAAWTTFGSYGLMAVLAWIAGQRAYPVRYAYGSLAMLGALGVAAVAAGLVLAPAGRFAAVALHLAIVAVFGAGICWYVLRGAMLGAGRSVVEEPA